MKMSKQRGTQFSAWRARRPLSKRRFAWASKAALISVLGLALATLITAQTPAVRLADPVRYLNNIKALTTPAMEGRGDGAPGLTRAAHLLEQQYKDLGLEPAGTQGFFQAF